MQKLVENSIEGYEGSIYFKTFYDVGLFGKSIADKNIKVIKCFCKLSLASVSFWVFKLNEFKINSNDEILMLCQYYFSEASSSMSFHRLSSFWIKSTPNLIGYSDIA